MIAGLVLSFSMVTLAGPDSSGTDRLLGVLVHQLPVIGVHSPEYAFEKVAANVASGARGLDIRYPVALDNSLSTWTNYRNRYWPAEYLIDAGGTVRHIKFGEGDYDVTENPIRQLLTDANPGTRPTETLTPETYLGVGKVVNYGTCTRQRCPTTVSRCADSGRWTIRSSAVPARSRSPEGACGRS